MNKKEPNLEFQKTIIARKAYVSIPTLGINHVLSKIDTGAYSSSLHCDTILYNEMTKEIKVHFSNGIYDLMSENEYVFTEFRQKPVRSSNGETQIRFVVNLQISLSGQTFETPFSLTNRGDMKHPILIGRKALKRRFIVDVSKKIEQINSINKP